MRDAKRDARLAFTASASTFCAAMIRLSAFLFLFLCSAAASSFAGSPWPEISSDLPPDPSLTEGVLPNGVRYLIRPNTEPRDRVTLRLVVAVGSIHERDEERGMAHFVEHMIFRGTRSHPGDSLVTALQRLGIGFGPDNTAFTDYRHTIYHLELPDTAEATLRQGLSTFREYASEATFDARLIERERGVILSEKATRDTAAYRSSEASVAALWPDSRHVRRPVIGTDETLRAFTRDQLVAFYDAWYRPDRMAIIVVGHVEKDVARRLIERTFSGLAARAPMREEPADAIPAKASPPNIFIHHDAGHVGLSLSFQHPRFEPRTPDTRARRTHLLHRALAFSMQQHRLNRIAAELGDALVSPTASIHDPIPGWNVASFSASGPIDHWKDLTTALEREHRRSILHGFSPAELELVRRSFAESLETNIRSAPTRRSESHAAELVARLLEGKAVTTPQAHRDDLAGPLTAATLDDCNRAYRETWERSALHVLISANPHFKESPQEVARVLNESRASPLTTRTEAPGAPFAYTDFGPPGQLVSEEKLPDLDARLTRFANGVRLNFKQTDFEADTVTVFLRISGGRLTMPAAAGGLDLLAEYAFINGGLGQHSASEIGTLLSGHNVGLSFHLEPDAFVLSARTSRRDLLLCLQLVAAFLTDPGYRPESLRAAQASYGSLLSALDSSAGGLIRQHASRQLFGGDARFGIAAPANFYNRTLTELEAWLKPALTDAAIEMSVVGDCPWEEVSVAVARTLGALPPRASTPSLVSSFKLPRFATAPRQPILYVAPARLKQSAIAWYFPVPDTLDFRTERRCLLLAAILEERIRQRLREELGSAYAPGAQFIAFDALPRCGHFFLYAEIDSERAPEAVAAVRKELESMRGNGITLDEFERVKAPFQRERLDHRRHNGYWGHTVLLDAQERPERLAAARDRTQDIAAITLPEIQSLFDKYIIRRKGTLFIAEPGRIRKWSGK